MRLAPNHTREQVQKEQIMQMTEAQSMTSQLVAQSGERRVMKIVTGALEFPTTELKERVKTLSHIDLVVSQWPI
jgi:hypothetical protein